MKTIALLRVSTNHQDIENQKFGILKYCMDKGFDIDEFVEETGVTGDKRIDERIILKHIQSLKKGDNLILAEQARLSRGSLFELFGVMDAIFKNGVTIHLVKENLVYGNNVVNDAMFAFANGISAQIEKQRISQRTSEAIRRKIAEGKQWGRRKGQVVKTKLTGKEDQILADIQEGKPIALIAQEHNVHPKTITRLRDKKMVKPNKKRKAVS